jgi:hypothetical protein
VTAPPTPAPPSWQSRRLLRTPRDNAVAAWIFGGTLLGVWIWWALAQGAFFGTVLFPGAVILYLVLALLIAVARFPVSMSGPHAIALICFVGLGFWTALSIIWSPAQDLAVDYAQRAFAYAAVFTIGLLFAAALRQRMTLAAVPMLAAGGVVAAVVLIRIWTTGDISSLIDHDSTLDFPFGYRNANAGFFVIIGLASVAFAARPATSPGARVTLAALSAVAFALCAISQSRGSLIAMAAGVVVLLAVAPYRGRALLGLLITIVPVALLFGELLDPYDAAKAGASSALSELQQAAAAAAFAGLVAALIAAATSVLEDQGAGDHLPVLTQRGKVAVWSVIALVGVGAAFVVASGPIADGVDAISSGDTSYSEVEGSRFSYGGGLDRADYWRVALEQARDNPLLGGGAGSFRSDYLIDREAGQAPRNAHSVWLEILGELGIPGLALLVGGFVFAIGATLRSRRLGPESAALTTVALTAFAAWAGQATLDWSWFFGGLTAPMVALLGSAAAPAALSFEIVPIRIRSALAIGAVSLTLIAVPTFISERLTLNAARDWPDDVEGAYRALDTAQSLNPFADVPLLVEANIAWRTDDEERALRALAVAQEREPDDWRSYYLAAQVLGADTTEGRAQLEQALLLNPKGPELLRLEEKVDDAPGRQEPARGEGES